MNDTVYSEIEKTLNVDFDKNGSMIVIDRYSFERSCAYQETDMLLKVMGLLTSKTDNAAYLLTYAYYNWLPDYFFTRPAAGPKHHPVSVHASRFGCGM